MIRTPAEQWWVRVGMAPGLLVFTTFGILPALATLVISLTNYAAISGVSVKFVGLQNFVQDFSIYRVGVLQSLRDTLLFSAGVTIGQNVLGVALAAVLRYPTRMSYVMRAVVFLPAVLGVTVIGLVWSLALNPSGGPGATALGWFGVRSAFFGSEHLALPLVIGVQIWSALGFTTMVYLGGMLAIPQELYEAARVDGGRGWWIFRQITWPLISTSVTINVILAVIGSLNVYDLIYVLTDGLYKTDTLGMLMFNTAFQGSGNLGYASSLSVLMFLLTLLVALPVLWWLRRREVTL